MNLKLVKEKRKGKLTDIEINKENIKIKKQEIEIQELQEDLEKAEKKLNNVSST
jgi:colicin import membrane protein